MNKFSISVFAFILAFSTLGQAQDTRAIQTKSGEDRANTSTKISSAGMTREGMEGGNACRSAISPKEIYGNMLNNKVHLLQLHYNASTEPITIKTDFTQSTFEGTMLTVKSEEGLMKFDLCGAYFMKVKEQEMEVRIGQK